METVALDSGERFAKPWMMAPIRCNYRPGRVPSPVESPSLSRRCPRAYRENRFNKNQRPPFGGLSYHCFSLNLQCGFDLETPRLKQGLWNVLGILVPARPLPQPGRAQILVRSQLILLNHLLELGHGWNNGSNGFGLTPIRITASLCHECLAYILVSLRLRFR